MKYNREYILRRAFDVFMTKGYDSTSISVLQEELDMSRGAMYRYFKNKEELFISVIDTYFFDLLNRLLKDVDEDILLPDLIELVCRRQKLILSVFMRSGITQSAFLNYTALIIQAAKHYPDFLKHFRTVNNRCINNWRIALQNSLAEGKIRSDANIDILSVLFNNANMKESSEEPGEGLCFSNDITSDVNRRKEMIDYLYSLIKV